MQGKPDGLSIHYRNVNSLTKRIGFEVFKDVLRAREFGACGCDGFFPDFTFPDSRVHKSVTSFHPIPPPTHLPIKGTGWGAALAKDAAANANGPGGYCYKWVGQALRRHGVNVSGASAYMGADQLAKNPKFREVKVNPQDLGKLPAGAVVVWNKGPGHPHGHISIALGNGKEASDKIRNQITNYGTGVRVFLPK